MDEVSDEELSNGNSTDDSTDSDVDSSTEETNLEQACLDSKGNAFYISCIERYFKLLYEDVTPMINSTVPTLVDGDALLLYAVLQQSHPVNAGNQFLHVAYVCERFLDVLMQKGTNCVLVFFELWEFVWEKNSPLRTLRQVIIQHFRSNTTLRTYNFLWYHSSQFQDFKREEKPRAILSNLHFNLGIKKFNQRFQNTSLRLNINHALKLFASSLVYCVANDLPLIDIDHVTIGVTLIYSFSIPPQQVKPEIYIKLRTELTNDIPPHCTLIPKQITMSADKMTTTRDLILEAAVYFLKNYETPNELKLLLLYYGVKFTLSTENRAPPKIKLDKEQLETLQNIIDRWHNCLYIVLSSIHTAEIKLDFQHIADLWQGTLFICTVNLITDPICGSSELGLPHMEYEDLVADLNSRCNHLNMNPYPIEPIIQSNCELLNKEEWSNDEMVKLTKVHNPLIDKFCENIFDQVLWENPAKTLDIKPFFEGRHWHCRKLIEDNFRDEIQKTALIHSSKSEDRRFQRESRYINIYGESLEGRRTEYGTVIYQDPKKCENVLRKQSRSSKLLLQNIQADKAKEALERDRKELQMFKENHKIVNNIKKMKNELHNIMNIINRMSCSETIIKSNVYKLKILSAIITYDAENKISGLKDIFLTIRTILKMQDETNFEVEINEKDKIYISKLLHSYGFKEVAQKNNLPMNDAFRDEHQYNWVRFQLEYLGADLLKETSGILDPDLNFAPDRWQSEFIEAIRHNESALVVAPTSSGKTFACYYCMKRVLQYSLDGIVVYVAPTKALVNQVAATVTHRFKNAKLPKDGTSLVGIFTRDYRNNPTTSRILITVPQCLDILLMCPHQHYWAKKVKYVIFDEVHRLSGNEEGLVWERLLLMIRCPFLALSATISDANLFYRWLQNIEHFKKEQDKFNNCLRESYRMRCIIHEERHADLTKYVYTPGHLQHYHPYCALHHRVLLDRGKIPESITLSPKETMQLYDVLSKHAQHHIPVELDYLKFFYSCSESGFITRNSVRDYEKKLGEIFYKIYNEEFEVYEAIIRDLTPINCEILSTGRISHSEGRMLLDHMANNNMLPAIVFSYNRKLCENFCKYMLPNIGSMSRKKSRRERRSEKQKRKMKQKRNEKGRKDNDIQFDGEDDFSMLEDGEGTSRNPINILAPTKSKFKGIGIIDGTDLEFVEQRLYHSYLKFAGTKFRKLIAAQLQSGLAYHHAGVDKKLRDTAEMLFRLGIVKVVVATGTLAVGVHMPCKSVVIFGDSPYLNSLEYHQMSGRAGRRGFDNEGNVIFLNLTKKRHDMLMTDKLPKMLGNYPIDVSLVVRLLLLVSGPGDTKKSSDEYMKTSLSKALALLENSLIFEVKPHLKRQVKHFVGFALQLLLMQQIISPKGIPTPWSAFIVHLHYHEPANLALTYLVRCGALTDLVRSTSDDEDLQWKLVVVLCYLFTKVPLSQKHLKHTVQNSVVILDPLPTNIAQALSQYNKEVKFVFNQYFLSVARHLRPSLGADNMLPLSKVQFKVKNYNLSEDRAETFMKRIGSVCYQREIISSFVALSGNKDNSLDTHQLISNIRHEICPEINIVPEIQTNRNLNGYALDFYRHGSAIAINRDNMLHTGQDYALLNDFRLAISTIMLALEDLQLEGTENQRLMSNFQIIQTKYNSLFAKAYHLRR